MATYIDSEVAVTVSMAFGDNWETGAPTWVDVTSFVRSIDTSRGRSSEYGVIGPGTMTLTIDNRDRRFDASYTTADRATASLAAPYDDVTNFVPMVPVKLETTEGGVTQPLFRGFVLGWQEAWSQVDGVSTVSCIDAMRILENYDLGSVSAYGATVLSDKPVAYFPFQNDLRDVVGGFSATVGKIATSAFGSVDGQIDFAETPDGLPVDEASAVAGAGVWGGGVDFSPSPQFAGGIRTVEFWVHAPDSVQSMTSGEARVLEIVVTDDGNTEWDIRLLEKDFDSTGDGRLTASFTDEPNGYSTGANRIGALSGGIPDWTNDTFNRTDHVVFTASADGTTGKMYVNGDLLDTLSLSSGAYITNFSEGVQIDVVADVGMSHLALYTDEMDAATVSDHFLAGFHGWGWPSGERAGARVGRILDVVGWSAADRDLGAGTMPLGRWVPSGGTALSSIRTAEAAEQGMFFVSADGKPTLRDRQWFWHDADQFDIENDIAWHSLFWAEGAAFRAQGLADGADVATWNNETGESDATQGTAADRPHYDASHASFNGRPVLDFDGSNHYLQTAAFGVAPDYSSGVSIVIVGRTSSTSAQAQTFVDGDDVTNRNTVYRRATGSDDWAIYAGTIRAGSAADTNAHLFVAQFDGGAGADTLELDGVSDISADAGSTQLDALTIGNNYQLTNGHLTGQIAFIGIYDKGDITAHPHWPRLEGRLEDLYGLTVTGSVDPVVRFTDDGAAGELTYEVLEPAGNHVDSIRNRISVTTDSEPVLREDTTSVSSYGPNAETIPARFDGHDAPERGMVLADYRIRIEKDGRDSIRRLSVNARKNPDLHATLCDIELGDVVTVEHTPLSVGSQVARQVMVTGISHRITPETWTVDFHCSPEIPNAEDGVTPATPTFVATGTKGDGAGAFTPGLPAGVQDDDLLIMIVESHDGTMTDTAEAMSTPGDWTLLGHAVSNTGVTARFTKLTVWWTIYDSASPPDRQVADCGDHGVGLCYAFRGVDTVTPIHVSQFDTGGQTTSHSATGVTTTIPNTRIVHLWAHGDNAAWQSNLLPSWLGLQSQANTTLGNDGTAGMGHGELAAADATGDVTWTSAVSEEMAACVLALTPLTPGYLTLNGTGNLAKIGTTTGNIIPG